MSDFKHKKSLGQNFLHDQGVLMKIKDSVDVGKDDLILEIGPGHGALTKYLKEFECNLICFEIDERVKEELSAFEDDKTKIIYSDFLKIDIKEVLKDYKYNNLYVIANLPYYITTPIITKFINEEIKVKDMVLMVQDEVANRFTSSPGCRDYGSITVYLNYYFDVNKLFVVSKNCFTPVPNVESAVIKLSSIDNKEIFDKDLFFKLVRDSFVHKRKNIRNNLFNYDLIIVQEILLKHGFDMTVRAEQLSLDVFIDLANRMSEV